MKRKFKSYVEAETAYMTADKDRTVTGIALNALLAGDVQWFQRGSYRAGVIRPNSACGGIVVVTYSSPGQSDYSIASYIDEWVSHRDSPISPGDQEAIDLRDLAYEVLRYRNGILASSAAHVLVA